MNPGAGSRQRGAVLILFFLALFLSGATVVLSALNNRTGLLARNVEMQLDMELAKEALLSYAMMYPIEYAAAGPGRLPCVDTNNDALPDCTAATLGRLPQRVTLPSGVPFSFSTAGAGVDEQLWYAVSTSFRTSAATVNASTAAAFTLDGAANIVAVLIAPGTPYAGQTRPSTLAARYLEDTNATGPAFVTRSALANFNDRVLAITRAELLTAVTPMVAGQMKVYADGAYVANGNTYPADLAAFRTTVAQGWVSTNAWHTALATYTRVSATVATFTFSNCGITFTITNGSNGLGRSQSSC